MAYRNPIGIYHRQDEIIFYGRRRNGKDLPNSRWAAITAPGQRALLDTEELDALRYTRGAVRKRTATDLANRRAATRAAADLAWLNQERQRARDSVLIDWVNELRAIHSLPALTAADLDAAFEASLTLSRANQ